MKSVFIIDDEIDICESIKMILEYEDYTVNYAVDSNEGLTHLSSNIYNAILLDIQMPGLNGFEVLKKIKEIEFCTAVIMISAHSSLENAIKATKLGAFDFIEKPIDRDKLLISIRNGVEHTKLLRENTEMKKSLVGEGKIIGQSKEIKNVLEIVEKVASTDVRVMITGENGTGKELFARAIHQNSLRNDKAFIEVNCAAIPNELIESELFGHEKGSFTGAHLQRIGKFELANKGTIFLDEIGDMSLQAQAKVLRAIEDGKIERVGGTKKIEVDVRIISATNKNLNDEISKGNFREDLFHRLNVIPLHVPPLQQRRDDIPLLINYFVEEITKKYKRSIPIIDDEAIKLMQSLPWKGNVRELRNVVERIIIMVPKQTIGKKDIDLILTPSSNEKNEFLLEANTFQQFKDKAEKAFIIKQLEANNWNISKTAEVLEIQRSHLYNKMKKFQINKEDNL